MLRFYSSLAIPGCALALAEDEVKRPAVYPFDVTVDGQLAEMQILRKRK